MEVPRPAVLIAAPYLTLSQPISFGGWWLGPLPQFEGEWPGGEFERAARAFLSAFRGADGSRLETPSLLVRDGNVTGEMPPAGERQALELALGFAVVDANPYWSTETAQAGWAVSTTENADIWFQPIAEDGSISLVRGGRVSTTSGGHNVFRDGFAVPAPLELHLPSGMRKLDAELLTAVYEVTASPAEAHVDRGHRIAAAIRWLLKSWQNTSSLEFRDRLVFLRTASEAITGTTGFKGARRLRRVFEDASDHEGGSIGIGGLLWSPNEPEFERHWTSDGQTVTQAFTALEHWYLAMGDERNRVVHQGADPPLVYEQLGSPYEGPMVEVGDRVLREAIKILLGSCGYPAVWRNGLSRASFNAYVQLSSGGST